MATYGRNRTYVIEGFDRKLNPTSTFHHHKREGKISYIDYYKEAYHIDIKQKDQPLIKTKVVQNVMEDGKQVRKEVEAYLVPELVKLTGIPSEVASNFKAMQEIADFTKMRPDTRFEKSKKLLDDLNNKVQRIEVGSPIEVQGYILPDVIYTCFKNATRKAKDGNIILKDKYKDPKDFPHDKYLLVYSATDRTQKEDDETADKLVDGLKQVSGASGIFIGDPVFVVIRKKGIEEWKSLISKNFQNDIIVVCLLHAKRDAAYYSELKRFLSNDLKVPSQVVLNKHFRDKPKPAVMSKLLGQMNAKVGGTLWGIPTQHPYFKEKSVMYGAISFSRGKKGWTLAFNGTYSRDLTHCCSEAMVNLPKKENIDPKVYEEILVNWLKKYNKENNQWPSAIILYREGLSDEQTKKEGKVEIEAMQRCIERSRKKTGANYNPDFLYIVVRKKIETRFFAIEGQAQTSGKFRPKLENPMPGTAIFEDLSSNNSYDFHLAPQKVTQGTCTPTHYVVAFDNSKIPQEAIAQFTN